MPRMTTNVEEIKAIHARIYQEHPAMEPSPDAEIYLYTEDGRFDLREFMSDIRAAFARAFSV